MSDSEKQAAEHPHVEEFVHNTRSSIMELQNHVSILQARVDSLERVLTRALLDGSQGLLIKNELASATGATAAASPNKSSTQNNSNASSGATLSPPQQQFQHQSQASPASQAQSTNSQPPFNASTVSQSYAMHSPTAGNSTVLPLMPFGTGLTPPTATANSVQQKPMEYDMERFGVNGTPFVQSMLPPMTAQQQQQQQQQHPPPSFSSSGMMNSYIMQQQREDAVMAMLNGQFTHTETPTGYGPIFPPTSAAAAGCLGSAGESSSMMDSANGVHMPPFLSMLPGQSPSHLSHAATAVMHGNYAANGYPMLNSALGNGMPFFDVNTANRGSLAPNSAAALSGGQPPQPHGMPPFNGMLPQGGGLAPAVIRSPTTANAVSNFLTRTAPGGSSGAGGAGGANSGSGAVPYSSSLDPARTTNETLDRVCQQNPWLKEVCLRGCKNVTNFIPLTRLRNLWKLNLQGCVQYVDDDLVRLIATYNKRLSRLNLCGCERITDATPLAQLSFLFDLNLSGCKIGDASLEAISRGCLQLSRLAINSCPNITNIACVSNLKELKLLYCRYSNSISPTSIAHVMCSIANSLLTVNVDGMRFTELNLSGMAGAPAALKNFNLKDNTEITHLRWLTTIPKMAEVFASLEMFDVEGCMQLSGINGLELLPSLKILRLSHTAVTHESLLKLATSLSITTLHLDGCSKITNLECLLKFPRLTKVVLSQSMCSENPAINGIAALRQSERIEIAFALPQNNNNNSNNNNNTNSSNTASGANSSTAKSDATTQGALSPAEVSL